MSVTAWCNLTQRQRDFLQSAIGMKVPIDATGKRGKLVSIAVTSDGFITGHTSPGHDRGVFLGKLPSDDQLAASD
jgi:hypothetical protein